MRNHVSGLLLAALMGTVGLAQAAPATYTLHEIVDGANHLNGSITVNDADANHLIVQGEITGWSFIATGPLAFSISSNPASALCSTSGGAPCLTVVGSDLVFDFDSRGFTGPRIQFANGPAQVEFLNAGSNAGGQQCSTPGALDCGQVEWFLNAGLGYKDLATGAIATLAAPVPGVPEPSAAGLLSVGLAAAAGLAAVRRRRG